MVQTIINFVTSFYNGYVELMTGLFGADFLNIANLLLVTGSLWTINTLMGGIMAWAGEEWNTKRFFIGILKGFLLGVCIMAFVAVMEAIPGILGSLDGLVKFDEESLQSILSVGQIVVIATVSIKKSVVKILEKVRVFMQSSSSEEEEVAEVNHVNLHLKDEDSDELFEEG